jgi:hypothetical protein
VSAEERESEAPVAPPADQGQERCASAHPEQQSGCDPDTRLYYDRLEQSGQLQDVTDEDDLSHLDPRVTHVRWPDGTIERIGYSGPPVGEG